MIRASLEINGQHVWPLQDPLTVERGLLEIPMNRFGVLQGLRPTGWFEWTGETEGSLIVRVSTIVAMTDCTVNVVQGQHSESAAGLQLIRTTGAADWLVWPHGMNDAAPTGYDKCDDTRRAIRRAMEAER